MTLGELNKKLGEQIDILTDPNTSYETKKEQANYVIKNTIGE